MVPISSDGETRSGSSSELQPPEPMETSNGVTSSVLGKRKDPGESESDRESVDDDEVKEEEEEEEEEENSDFEWDKDSFDGKEYHSSDEYISYMEDEEQQMRKNRCYHRTVIESKGFFENTDGFPVSRWGGFGRVHDLDSDFKYGMTVREFLIHMATLCVDKYNRTKKKNVRFHHFLRANYHPGGFTKYYISFLARESDSLDDPLIEYQAKVGRRQGKTYPILCRPSLP